MTAAAAADEMYWKLACSQVCPRRYHTCQHGAMWNSAKHIRTEKEQDEMIVHSCYVTGRHAKPGRDISSAMPLLFVLGVFFVHGKSQAFPSRDFLDMNLKALCLLFQKKNKNGSGSSFWKLLVLYTIIEVENWLQDPKQHYSSVVWSFSSIFIFETTSL